MTGPYIKGMYQQAINAKVFALERLADEELVAKATPEQIARLKRMVKSGENAEKALRDIASREAFE